MVNKKGNREQIQARHPILTSDWITLTDNHYNHDLAQYSLACVHDYHVQRPPYQSKEVFC